MILKRNSALETRRNNRNRENLGFFGLFKPARKPQAALKKGGILPLLKPPAFASLS